MSSLPLAKKFQCHDKASKRFAKFTRAVRKTPRRIADLLGSTLSPSRNRSITDTTYASINGLYEWVPNLGGEGKGDAIVRPESSGVVSGHDIEPESVSVGDGCLQLSEEWVRVEWKCPSPFDVNERAERFIESQRKSFKEDDQKLQRQRSVHDH